MSRYKIRTIIIVFIYTYIVLKTYSHVHKQPNGLVYYLFEAIAARTDTHTIYYYYTTLYYYT